MTTPNLLIVDSFEPHCSAELKNELAKKKCILSIIPEGCSSQLQPLGVEITRTFQVNGQGHLRTALSQN